MAQLDGPSDWRPGGRRFNPRRGRQHSFMEIDHEIFSTVILSLPLIQEGQFSVSGKRMCTILVNRLKDQACPVNMWLGKLTALDMTPFDWAIKPQHKQTVKCRTGLDNVWHTRMTTLPLLLFALSPFVIFDSDYALISCLLCKSNTLWNIFMILGRNAEQDKTTCHVQD